MITDRSKEAKGALRFLEYFLTRNIGTAADCLVVWLLADFVFKGSYVGENIVSPTISFEVACVVNYITSSLWVYAQRIDDHSMRGHLRRFFKFNVSSILGYLIKMGLLLLIDHWFGWHVVICNLVALSIAGLFNFSTSELWVFGKQKAATSSDEALTEEAFNLATDVTGDEQENDDTDVVG